MAFESVFWRSQIKREISFIKKKMNINVSKIDDEIKFESLFSYIEIKLFIIAYSLRKLMDTHKFPDKVSKTKIKLSSFKKINTKEKIAPFQSPEKHYDFTNEIKKDVSLRYICSQFVHTFYFQLLANSRGKIRYIEFVSKDDKDKCIYLIEIDYLLNRVLSIIDKDVKKMTCCRDDNEKDGYTMECF